MAELSAECLLQKSQKNTYGDRQIKVSSSQETALNMVSLKPKYSILPPVNV